MEPGFWQAGEPTFDLDAGCPATDLGNAVESALQASDSNRPYDRATRDQWPAVQRLAKARSWGLFIKGSRHLVVERRPTGVLVYAPNESDVDASDAEESLPSDATGEGIGVAVLRVAEEAVPHSGAKPG
jgi:hypothetical protein